MSGPEGNIRILAKTNSFPEPLSLRVLFYSHIFTQRNKFESIKVGTYKNTGLIHKGQRQHPKKKINAEETTHNLLHSFYPCVVEPRTIR